MFSRERESYLEGRWGSCFKMAFPSGMLIRDKLIPELSIPVDVSLFSDSIIVSYKPEQRKRFVEWYSQLTQIFHDICRLQATFAAEGFYIRRGLSYGKLYHVGDVCIGGDADNFPYLAAAGKEKRTYIHQARKDEQSSCSSNMITAPLP